MNVEIKPLVWSGSTPLSAESSLGTLVVYWTNASQNWGWSAAQFFASGCGFATVDEAKWAAERWYDGKVADCLEPADPDAALAMLAITDRQIGLYKETVK